MGYLDNIASKVNSLDAKDRFNLLEISVDKLIPSKNNFYGIREIEELADSIRETGLLHNLVVRKLDSGMYEILSGERRFRALRLLNYSKIPCQVIENLSDLDSERLLIIANSSARELTPEEKFKQANRLKEIYKLKKKNGESLPKGKTRDIIGKDLGISGSQVAKYQALGNKLTEEVKEKIEDKTINLEQAKILSKLPKLEQNIKVQEIEDKGPDEVDILIRGIEQPIDEPIEPKTDESIGKPTEQETDDPIEDNSLDRDMVKELNELLEVDGFPKLVLHNQYCKAMLYTSKTEIKDNKIQIKLSGIGRENFINIEFNELTKVTSFPNRIKPKRGYRINNSCYLWFKY